MLVHTGALTHLRSLSDTHTHPITLTAPPEQTEVWGNRGQQSPNRGSEWVLTARLAEEGKSGHRGLE